MNEQERPAEKSPVPSDSDLDDADLESVSGGSSYSDALKGGSCLG